jgi:hypothetical protein
MEMCLQYLKIQAGKKRYDELRKKQDSKSTYKSLREEQRRRARERGNNRGRFI